MKILKVYDKINRNILYSDEDTGNIYIKEYLNDNDYIYIVLNTKIFKSNSETKSYFSLINFESGCIKETLDITGKYILYKKNNEDGKLILSERIHIKDEKSFYNIYRIYDEDGCFIELENHKGVKNFKYTVKQEIINELLKIDTDGK